MEEKRLTFYFFWGGAAVLLGKPGGWKKGRGSWKPANILRLDRSSKMDRAASTLAVRGNREKANIGFPFCVRATEEFQFPSSKQPFMAPSPPITLSRNLREKGKKGLLGVGFAAPSLSLPSFLR